MTQLHCEQAHPWEVAVSIHLSHLAIHFTKEGTELRGNQTLGQKERDYESPALTLPLNEYSGNCILFSKRNENQCYYDLTASFHSFECWQ